MNIVVTKIRHSNFGRNNDCCLEFSADGNFQIEYIDVQNDFNLCTSYNSNLYLNARDQFAEEEIDEIHSQLVLWLKNNPVSENEKKTQRALAMV